MKLSLRTFWGLLWCWTQRIPVLQAQALCHLSEEAVRHWYWLFRIHLPAEDPILEGKIQANEAYFRKIALLMAKQIGSRKLAFRIFGPSVDKEAACRFVFQCVRPRSRLQTDGASIYRGIEQRWPVSHRRDIHARFEFALTSEIEGVFGNLRTFLRRMYHHVTPKYVPDLVGEFAARFTHAEWFDSPHAYLQIALPSVPLA